MWLKIAQKYNYHRLKTCNDENEGVFFCIFSVAKIQFKRNCKIALSLKCPILLLKCITSKIGSLFRFYLYFLCDKLLFPFPVKILNNFMLFCLLCPFFFNLKKLMTSWSSSSLLRFILQQLLCLTKIVQALRKNQSSDGRFPSSSKQRRAKKSKYHPKMHRKHLDTMPTFR